MDVDESILFWSGYTIMTLVPGIPRLVFELFMKSRNTSTEIGRIFLSLTSFSNATPTSECGILVTRQRKKLDAVELGEKKVITVANH